MRVAREERFPDHRILDKVEHVRGVPPDILPSDGTNLGTDTVGALVRHTATASINSLAVAMEWTLAAVPAVQGWIGGPVNGSTVTGIVPITVGAGVTLTQGSVEYAPTRRAG